MPVQIKISQDNESWVREAADEVVKQVKKTPASRLSFATGATTLPLFDELVKLNHAGEIDFSKVSAFQLDEYHGLERDNPASCTFTLKDRFYNHINIRPENCFFLDSKCNDPEDHCREYEALIREWGGIDLQVLGIGLNGHIGFNQPGTQFTIETHPAEVDDFTWEKNSKFFKSVAENPREALTMGTGTIMSAKKILLLANGSGKKDIVCKALFGPVSPDIPASVLQNHPDLIVILDPSLSKLCSP
jgi:glucosamine-6-phosphate deaminase